MNFFIKIYSKVVKCKNKNHILRFLNTFSLHELEM